MVLANDWAKNHQLREEIEIELYDSKGKQVFLDPTRDEDLHHYIKSYKNLSTELSEELKFHFTTKNVAAGKLCITSKDINPDDEQGTKESNDIPENAVALIRNGMVIQYYECFPTLYDKRAYGCFEASDRENYRNITFIRATSSS